MRFGGRFAPEVPEIAAIAFPAARRPESVVAAITVRVPVGPIKAIRARMIADCWLRDRVGIVVRAPVLAEQKEGIMPRSFWLSLEDVRNQRDYIGII